MLSFDLAPGEVHLWVVDLDAPPLAAGRCRSLLSPDEIERAERFRFEHLRLRYISGRGILRHLLGGYVQVAPEDLAFRYGAHGKPELAASPASDGLMAFNLAHTQNLAVYAFALALRVGADVEQVRPLQDRDQLVQQFFSPREWRELAALPAAQRDEGFFLGWTRKEAYLKALGAGLTYPLDRFSVSLTPGEPALLLDAAQGDDAWTLLPFTPAAQHCGAVAIEGRNWVLRVRRWEAATALRK